MTPIGKILPSNDRSEPKGSVAIACNQFHARLCQLEELQP
jgi:hypothetical protein